MTASVRVVPFHPHAVRLVIRGAPPGSRGCASRSSTSASKAPTGALPTPAPSAMRTWVVVQLSRFWSVFDATNRTLTKSARALSSMLTRTSQSDSRASNRNLGARAHSCTRAVLTLGTTPRSLSTTPFPAAAIIQREVVSSHLRYSSWKNLIAARYPLTVDCWLLNENSRQTTNSSKSVSTSDLSSKIYRWPPSLLFHKLKLLVPLSEVHLVRNAQDTRTKDSTKSA